MITRIEGKDSNYIMSAAGQRFYPSFFNDFVNQLNRQVKDSILEIKVYERNQQELEVQFIVRDAEQKPMVERLALEFLHREMSMDMHYTIRFVDFIDHDYRRKYRVIERIGDVEFAGGMVGDARKTAAIKHVEAEAAGQESRAARDAGSSVNV